MGGSHCCQNHQPQIISLNPVTPRKTKSQLHIIEPKRAESILELEVIMQVYEEILDDQFMANNQQSEQIQALPHSHKDDLDFKFNVVNTKYDCMMQQSISTRKFTGMRTDLSTIKPECTFYRVPFGEQLQLLTRSNKKVEGFQRSLTRRISSSSISSNRRQVYNGPDQSFKLMRVDSEDILSKSRSSSKSNCSRTQNQNNQDQKIQQSQFNNQSQANLKITYDK